MHTWSKRTSRCVVVWFVALLVLPLATRVVGNNARDVEGVGPTPFPGLKPAALLDAAYYQALGSYFDQHLPVRDEAIELNARIAMDVFRDSPTREVSIGNDGWLFQRREIVEACADRQPMSRYVDVVDQLVGLPRPVTVVVPPPKLVIERGEFRDGSVDSSCLEAASAQLRSELARPVRARVVDAFAVLEQSVRTDGHAFLRTDSHLTDPARVQLVRAVIETMKPGLWDDAAVVDSGLHERATDLRRMAGIGGTENASTRLVRRTGAALSPSLVPGDDPDPATVYRTTGVAVVPGRTLVIHDSQFAQAAGELVPWFAETQFLNWDIVADAQFADAVNQADQIIVETVHNGLAGRVNKALVDLLK